VIEPVDVIETEEGGVAQLVTAAGDQWWLRVKESIVMRFLAGTHRADPRVALIS